LKFDPGVKFAIDFREPGSDPFSGDSDGRIRAYELGVLTPELGQLTLISGAPDVPDVVFEGELEVGVLLGSSQAEPLFTADVAATWDDITDLDQFALTGSELLKEVNRRFKEALLAGVEQVATFARGISSFDVFHVQVPLLGGTIGDYLDLGGMLQDRLTDPLTTYLTRLPPDAFPTVSGMLRSLGIRATVQDGNLRLQFGDGVTVSFTNNE